MTAFIAWYVLVTVFGAVAWPLIYRLLPGLPDRGYSLARAAGLLLIGFVFWLLASFGILPNTPGAVVLALLIVLGAAIWSIDRSLLNWLRDNLRMVIVAEVIFLVAFAGWALVRAGNPDLIGTEKPMELAFLNGIRMSDTFPPRDPWLSGYAISYYYFGYVMVAMLADLSGVVTGVAFNLGVALVFGLAAVGSFGVVYNLLRGSTDPRITHAKATAGAVLAPIFVLLVGNLAAFFDLLRVRFPALLPAGFWSWLDIKEMNQPVAQAITPLHEVRFNWFWRSSRVIHDRLPNGESFGLQPIDEFPMFSFLLADLHPHVLALPFVLLAVALAHNALVQKSRLDAPQFAFYVIVFGGLAFLNTWDLPIYLFVLVAALAIRGVRQRGGLDAGGVIVPFGVGALIVVLGVLAYLPWVMSFSSQAGGILPNALFPTRFHQYLVMFGVFMPLVVWFVLAAARDASPDWGAGVLLAGGLLLSLIVLMLGMGFGALRLEPNVRGFVYSSLGLAADAPVSQAFMEVVLYRLTHPLTPLILTTLIAVVVALLFGRRKQSPSNAFVAILMLTALLLTLGPEFVYLRDNFGHRINTIFKFYYAAWILFALSAAYAAVWLIVTRRRVGQTLASLLVVALIAAGLVYPRHALPGRGVNLVRTEGDPPLTLDGLAYLERTSPDEALALAWVAEHLTAEDVILEAVGGAYSSHGRVSASTGVPTILGWSNHQRQWRGELYPLLVGGRETDVQEIYTTPSIQRALDLLRQYDVTYIFVGPLERNPDFSSPVGIEKFERYFTPVFQSGDVIIYRVDPLREAQE